MGSVDHFGQLISTYSISCRHWRLRIFYHCLHSCSMNSYIYIYTQQISQTKKPMPHLKFGSVLATVLIETYSGRIKPGSSTGD